MSDWKLRLEEAKGLFESGIISESDFEERKVEILKTRDSLSSNGVIDVSAGVDQLVEMVLIPAGEFLMGGLPDDEDVDDYNEKPRHKVEITKDFYVGKYLVTQSLWKAVVGDNPSEFKGENHPVEKVSWFDCVAFCNKLSKLEGKDPVYQGLNDYEIGQYLTEEEEKRLNEQIICNWNTNGYRLLSEAEWEYSARGGEYHLFSGSNNLDEVAWYHKNSGGKTHPVGQKKPNGFGLYDMSGNVLEWVWDWLRYYSTEKQVNPTSEPDGIYHFWRGGGWRFTRKGQRVSCRPGLGDSISRLYDVGFRLGRTR